MKTEETRRFTVKGTPVPKARPRVTRTGHAYTPKKTVAYESKVRQAYSEKYDKPLPKDIPLYVEINFFLPIPKSWAKAKKERARCEKIFPTGRPDLDNLYKGVADALNGVAYEDDSQIVYCNIAMMYSDEPRADVCIGEYR